MTIVAIIIYNNNNNSNNNNDSNDNSNDSNNNSNNNSLWPVGAAGALGVFFELPLLQKVRPISLLTLSLLTLLESNLPGKSLGIPYGPGNSTPLN